MPFVWPMNEQNCLEGLIDLAVFHPAEKRWFILDWKTNRIRPLPDELDQLRIAYRPQITAYCKAVTEITKQPVGAGIYSTSTGKLIVYDEDELAKEWQRLKDLPPDDLAGETGDSR
jgi:ATP-dependent exoDNAse (exonuclease V) beta subunit